MITLNFGNFTKEIAEGWHEVTLREYVQIFKLEEQFNLTKESSEKDLLRYQKNFCELIIDELLDNLPVEKANEGLSLTELFNFLSWRRTFPKEEEIKQIPFFFHNGKKYVCHWKELNSLNKEVPLKSATYGEYVHASMVRELFNELSSGNIERMALLTAILYRPEIKVKKGWFKYENKIEPYNEVTAEARAKDFECLTMDKIFGAYFFLKMRMQQSLHNLSQCLQGVAKEKEAV